MITIGDQPFQFNLYTYPEVISKLKEDSSYNFKDIIPCVRHELSTDNIPAAYKVYNPDFMIGYCLTQKAYKQKIIKKDHERVLGYTIEGDTEALDDYMCVKGEDLESFMNRIGKGVEEQIKNLISFYTIKHIDARNIYIADVHDRIAYSIVMNNFAKSVGKNIYDITDTDYVDMSLNDLNEIYKLNDYYLLFLFKEDLLDAIINYISDSMT